VQPVRKVEAAAVAKRVMVICCLLGGWATGVRAQDLPADEFRVNFAGYFDNFNVSVIYPNMSLTKRVSASTSLTGRYLVDMVTAASIKQNKGGGGERESEDERSGKKVDAVTAASAGGGEGFGGPDDIRQEVGLGATQILAGRIVSLNGLFSKENDYSSGTIAGTVTQVFAKKNTTVQLGFVRSWDRVYPKTKTWTRTNGTKTISANISQVLGKGMILQMLYSHTDRSGYLADAYKTVVVGADTLDPAHPDSRIRQAAAVRFSYRLGPASSLQAGYRYYWDTWSVSSHTISGMYQRRVSPVVTLGFGFRTNIQTKASFFRPVYTTPQTFMTVDNKLDAGFSNELQLKLILNGRRGRSDLPFLSDDRLQYNIGLNIYQRHTDAPDWFSHSRNLVATFFSMGLRYRF